MAALATVAAATKNDGGAGGRDFRALLEARLSACTAAREAAQKKLADAANAQGPEALRGVVETFGAAFDLERQAILDLADYEGEGAIR